MKKYVLFISLFLFCYVFANDPLFPCPVGFCRKAGLLPILPRVQARLTSSKRSYTQGTISQCFSQEEEGWLCGVRTLLSSSHLESPFPRLRTHFERWCRLEGFEGTWLEGDWSEGMIPLNLNEQVERGRTVDKTSYTATCFVASSFLTSRAL